MCPPPTEREMERLGKRGSRSIPCRGGRSTTWMGHVLRGFHSIPFHSIPLPDEGWRSDPEGKTKVLPILVQDHPNSLRVEKVNENERKNGSNGTCDEKTLRDHRSQPAPSTFVPSVDGSRRMQRTTWTNVASYPASWRQERTWTTSCPSDPSSPVARRGTHETRKDVAFPTRRTRVGEKDPRIVLGWSIHRPLHPRSDGWMDE